MILGIYDKLQWRSMVLLSGQKYNQFSLNLFAMLTWIVSSSRKGHEDGEWCKVRYYRGFRYFIIWVEITAFQRKVLEFALQALHNRQICLCLNVSATPITTMPCRQCLPLSVVRLKGKHSQKTHCLNGVVECCSWNPNLGRKLIFWIYKN